jgi:parallel beta-helix repeat protein
MIRGNTMQSCQESGIVAINSQNSTVASNQVYSCAPWGAGIELWDSDNSAVTGNVVQQCAVGVELGISLTRNQGNQFDSLYSYGYTFTGNTVCRNYFGGVLVQYAHGFKITGNVLTDNGQGGSDGTLWTIEPGLMALIGQNGSGYLVGDVVTLDPANGVGTPAKAVVCRATGISGGAGGLIYPEGLLMISAGTYTTNPTNPVRLSLGHGVVTTPAAAWCTYTSSKIAAGGSGYSVGQALRHNINANDPNMINPVRVMVTSVGAGGSVTGYVVMDGGGYLNNSFSTLQMVGDAYSPQGGLMEGAPGVWPSDTGSPPPSTASSGPGIGIDKPDLPDTGAGFTISTAWGKRYSLLFNVGAGATYNLETYHGLIGGVISGNIISRCRTGCGYLNLGSTPYNPTGANDRAYYLMFSGNSMVNNKYPFKGGTVATNGAQTLDNFYNIPLSVTPYPPTSIFDSQVKSGGTLVGTAPLNNIA